MSDQALLDLATQRVLNNENALKAYKRYGLTQSIAEQVLAQYRMLTLEAARPGP